VELNRQTIFPAFSAEISAFWPAEKLNLGCIAQFQVIKWRRTVNRDYLITLYTQANLNDVICLRQRIEGDVHVHAVTTLGVNIFLKKACMHPL